VEEEIVPVDRRKGVIGTVSDHQIQPMYDESGITIYQGDALTVLRTLPSESVSCCVTSPPYW
jgi:hypothetical protein